MRVISVSYALNELLSCAISAHPGRELYGRCTHANSFIVDVDGGSDRNRPRGNSESPAQTLSGHHTTHQRVHNRDPLGHTSASCHPFTYSDARNQSGRGDTCLSVLRISCKRSERRSRPNVSFVWHAAPNHWRFVAAAFVAGGPGARLRPSLLLGELRHRVLRVPRCRPPCGARDRSRPSGRRIFA